MALPWCSSSLCAWDALHPPVSAVVAAQRRTRFLPDYVRLHVDPDRNLVQPEFLVSSRATEERRRAPRLGAPHSDGRRHEVAGQW